MVVRTESALGLASIPSGMIYEWMSVCEHLKFALILCIIKLHEKKHIPYQTLPMLFSGRVVLRPCRGRNLDNRRGVQSATRPFIEPARKTLAFSSIGIEAPFLVWGWRGRDLPDIVARWKYHATMKKATLVEVKLTVRLPIEMHAALVAAARQHNRSLNGEMLTAARDHLKKSQKEQRKP